MGTDNYETICRIATDFRTAIDIALDEKGSLRGLERFPHGCCGIVSNFLAEYFLENNVNHIEYVTGEYINEESIDFQKTHTWLVVSGYYVDITGDQFSDSMDLYFDEPIYVSKSSDFHLKFSNVEKTIYYGKENDWPHSIYMQNTYDIIVSYIK